MIAIIKPEKMNIDSLLNLSFYGLTQTIETLGFSFDLIKEIELTHDQLSKYLIIVLLDPNIYRSDTTATLSIFLENGGMIIKSDFDMSKVLINNNKHISFERWIRHNGNHQIFENIPTKLPFFFENDSEQQSGSYDIKDFDIIDTQNKKIVNAVDFVKIDRGQIIQFRFPLFSNIGFILAGSDDIIHSKGIKRDKYGRTIGKTSLFYKNNLLNKPIVHAFQNLFLNIIVWVAVNNNIPILRKWFWPGKYKTAVCLTHDVDDVMGYAHVLKRLPEVLLKRDIPFTKKIKTLKIMGFYGYNRFFLNKPPPLKKVYNILDNGVDVYEDYFKEWIELERRYNCNATYFLLSRFDYHFEDIEFKRVVNKLKLHNLDIEAHGSIESSGSVQKMSEEKAYFERNIENRACGIRQHGLVFRLPQTWNIQSQAGYKFDSSVYFNDIYGFRMGTSFPFIPYQCTDYEKEQILELPLIVMEESLFAKEYLGLSEEDGINVFLDVFNKIKKYNGCFTMLWHPVTILEKYLKLNRWKFNLRLSTLNLYNKVLGELSKYEDVWFASAKDVISWWENRNKIILRECIISKEQIYLKIINYGIFKKITLCLSTNLNTKNIIVKNKDKKVINNYFSESNKSCKSFFIPLEIAERELEVIIKITY